VGQSSLLALGSLRPNVAIRLLKRPHLVNRYMSLEMARAAVELSACLPKNVAEAMGNCFSGPRSESPEASLRQAEASDVVIPDPPAEFGSILPRKLLQSQSQTPGGSASGSSAAARSLQADDKTGDETDESEESRMLELLMRFFSSPLSWEGPLFRLLKNLVDIHPESGSPIPGQGGGQELDMKGVMVEARGGHRGVVVARAGRGSRRSETRRTPGFVYPEWDWQSDSYRPNWCHVSEYHPLVRHAADHLPRCSDAELRRGLSRLRLSHQWKGRLPDGIAIDLDALVDSALGRASGQSGDDRVYRAPLRTVGDLAVMVLLDASGSTDQQGKSGSTTWSQQQALCARLVAELEAVGNRVAAYGFSSQGRQVRFLRIKTFDSRFDQAAQRRLQSIEPSGFTRMGAAIRHATHLLRTKGGTSHQLLVLISDGFPYDEGYREDYAERDSQHSLSEAVAAGVGCVCLSLGAAADAAMLDRIWRNITHLQLDDAGEANRHVVRMFESALLAAESDRLAPTSVT
jgi:nitric oxide reductase activation protein